MQRAGVLKEGRLAWMSMPKCAGWIAVLVAWTRHTLRGVVAATQNEMVEPAWRGPCWVVQQESSCTRCTCAIFDSSFDAYVLSVCNPVLYQLSNVLMLSAEQQTRDLCVGPC
jgi:hypothetical protein